MARDSSRAGQRAFIESLRPHAVRAAAELGIPPEYIIGQAALETGWNPAGTGGNLFGVKGPGAIYPTTEYEGGKPRRKLAGFRQYGSPGESVADYARLLKARYPGAVGAQSPEEFGEALKRGGYATDPGYASKVAGAIKSVLDFAVPAAEAGEGGALSFDDLIPEGKPEAQGALSFDDLVPAGGEQPELAPMAGAEFEEMKPRPLYQQMATAAPYAAGALAPLAVPGLVAGSGLAALGVAGGELIKRAALGEPIDPVEIAKEAGKAGLGGLVFGGVLKPVAFGARKLFGAGKLSPEARQAVEVAREERIPLPIGSVREGGIAPIIEQASGKTVTGGLVEKAGRRKMADWAESQQERLTRGLDSKKVAQESQQRLSAAWETSKSEAEAEWRMFEELLPPAREISARNTMEALGEAKDRLFKAGLRSHPVFFRIEDMLAAGGDTRAVGALNDIRRSIASGGRGKGGTDEIRNIKRSIEDAVRKDYKAAGEASGIDFGEMFERAKEGTKIAKDLERIPGFKQAAQESDKTWNWYERMFESPDASKALPAFQKILGPEQFDDMVVGYLGSRFERFSKSVPNRPGTFIDGKAFRGWFEGNKGGLGKVLSPEQMKVLDNFSAYMKFASPDIAALKAGEGGFSMGSLVGSGIAGMGGLSIPAEAGSMAMMHSLMNPRSPIYRMFLKESKPGVLMRLGKRGIVGAGAAAGAGAQ